MRRGKYVVAGDYRASNTTMFIILNCCRKLRFADTILLREPGRENRGTGALEWPHPFVKQTGLVSSSILASRKPGSPPVALYISGPLHAPGALLVVRTLVPSFLFSNVRISNGDSSSRYRRQLLFDKSLDERQLVSVLFHRAGAFYSGFRREP